MTTAVCVCVHVKVASSSAAVLTNVGSMVTRSASRAGEGIQKQVGMPACCCLLSLLLLPTHACYSP